VPESGLWWSGTDQSSSISITLSENAIIWDIITGTSPFSAARGVPEILRSLSLLVTKCMNYEIFVEDR